MRLTQWKRSYRILLVAVLLTAGCIVFFGDSGWAQTTLPKVTIGIEKAEDREDISITLQILALMTVLSLALAILIMMTSFTRTVVIFHFLRQALGTPQMPSNQILIGLALFLTLYIMTPVYTAINDTALQPYLAEEIQAQPAFDT